MSKKFPLTFIVQTNRTILVKCERKGGEERRKEKDAEERMEGWEEGRRGKGKEWSLRVYPSYFMSTVWVSPKCFLLQDFFLFKSVYSFVKITGIGTTY